MHHSVLGPGLILFAAPALAIGAGQPKGLIRSSYSIVPTTSTSIPDDPRVSSFSSHTVTSSSTASSTVTNSSTNPSVYTSEELKRMWNGVLGPCSLDQDLHGNLSFTAPRTDSYVINCKLEIGELSSSSVGQEPKVFYREQCFGPTTYNLRANETVSLPALSCSKEHLVKDMWAIFWIRCYEAGVVETVTSLQVRPKSDWIYDLPSKSGFFSLPAAIDFIGEPQKSFVATYVWETGFSNHQTILSNGQVPFSNMKLTIKDDPRRLSTLSLVSGTLTLNNHLNDFVTGVSDGAVRTWELGERQTSYDHMPILKTPCLYNPATGLMRDGKNIRGSEFLTNDFYLPPCKKEEVGTKQYSFSLTMKYKDVNGTFTINNSFTIDAVSEVASGCEAGDYCVGVR